MSNKCCRMGVFRVNGAIKLFTVTRVFHLADMMNSVLLGLIFLRLVIKLDWAFIFSGEKGQGIPFLSRHSKPSILLHLLPPPPLPATSLDTTPPPPLFTSPPNPLGSYTCTSPGQYAVCYTLSATFCFTHLLVSCRMIRLKKPCQCYCKKRRNFPVKH